MKIALVSPPLLKTPPEKYGGLEMVVYDLGCALVELGQDVTLIAPKGSRIPGANLIETIEAPGRTDVDWIKLELDAAEIYAPRLNEFDIIHDNTWFGVPYMAKKAFKDLKICHTHHGHLDWKPQAVPDFVKPLNLIGISKWMQTLYQKVGFNAKYVYNGVDMGKYQFSAKERENRFIYVGRISPFKQPHLVIDIAEATGIPVDIVGGSFVDNQQYLDDIRIRCAESKGLATLHLDATHEEKISLMQRAKAFFMPSAMGEPFGLVAVESMACGTPVIALNDGAISEVIGDAGYICKDYDEMLKVAKYDKFKSPKNCRERAEVFDRKNMAKDYLKLYQEILDGKGW